MTVVRSAGTADTSGRPIADSRAQATSRAMVSFQNVTRPFASRTHAATFTESAIESWRCSLSMRLRVLTIAAVSEIKRHRGNGKHIPHAPVDDVGEQRGNAGGADIIRTFLRNRLQPVAADRPPGHQSRNQLRRDDVDDAVREQRRADRQRLVRPLEAAQRAAGQRIGIPGRLDREHANERQRTAAA